MEHLQNYIVAIMFISAINLITVLILAFKNLGSTYWKEQISKNIDNLQKRYNKDLALLREVTPNDYDYDEDGAGECYLSYTGRATLLEKSKDLKKSNVTLANTVKRTESTIEDLKETIKTLRFCSEND